MHLSRWWLLRLCLVAGLLVPAGALSPGPGVAAAGVGGKIDPWLRLALAARAPLASDSAAAGASAAGPGLVAVAPSVALGRLAGPESPLAPVFSAGPNPLLDVLVDVRGDHSRLAAAGARVRARVGDVVAARVPADRLGALAALPEVRRIRADRQLRTLNDISVPATGAVAVHEELGYTGRGAIVAVVDTGVDFGHPDFRNPDGSTRIKALLDLSMPGDPDADGDLNGPVSGGTAYTEADINAALADNGAYFAATGLPVRIPDNRASGVSVKVTVDQPIPIQSLLVDLAVDHDALGEVAAQLVAPSGTQVTLRNAVGNPQGQLDGTFDLTAKFASQPAKGVWTVKVGDRGGGGTGQIEHFALRINQRVPQADLVGHGSHVAASAAGNGGAGAGGFGAYRGMAPEADLIVVKGTRSKTSGSFFSSDIVAALGWVDSTARALGQPYVVNLSLGGGLGPRDGTDPEEVAIDSLTGPGKPGAVAVIAAGNSGDTHNHAGGLVPRYGTANVGYRLESSASIVLLDLWYSGEDDLPLGFRTPNYAGRERVALVRGQDSCFADQAEGDVICLLWDVDLANRDNHVVILTLSLDSFGEWRFWLHGDDVPAGGRFDAWILGESGEEFSVGVDDRMRIESPATARNGIAVGASVSRDAWPGVGGKQHTCAEVLRSLAGKYCAPVGSMAAFSSDGPTRDGRRKPELVAPGQWIASALSKDRPKVDESWLVTDGRHTVDLGTSMAAPHVSGAAALLLGIRPDLDAGEMRELLTLHARPRTETLADDRWGWGELDVRSAAAAIMPTPTATATATHTPTPVPTATATRPPSATPSPTVPPTTTPTVGRRLFLPILYGPQ